MAGCAASSSSLAQVTDVDAQIVAAVRGRAPTSPAAAAGAVNTLPALAMSTPRRRYSIGVSLTTSPRRHLPAREIHPRRRRPPMPLRLSGLFRPCGAAAPTRQQFAHREGLGQVIVGAGIEHPDLVVPVERADSTSTGADDQARKSSTNYCAPSPSGRPRSSTTRSGLQRPASIRTILPRGGLADPHPLALQAPCAQNGGICCSSRR